MKFGNDDLAKYTFLPEAGDFIRAQGISVKDLVSPDFSRVVARAEQRVRESISPGKVSDKTADSREIEIMSFPVSLMLVKSTNLSHLIDRYALAEALRVEAFLKQEKNENVIVEIFQNFLSVKLEKTENQNLPRFRLDVPEYISRAIQFHKPEWKLVNKIVENGKVYITQQDLIRLIREEIREMIMQRLSGISLPKLPDSLQSVVKDLILSAPPPPRSTYSIINVKPEDYPPCVREALSLLEKGQNVPHYGRFLMTTYLLAVGKSADEIVALFPKAPDFKQSVTRYQVEHIAGIKGGKTKYSVPSCRTLQTHSFCFKDPIKCCEISSPIQFPSRRSPTSGTSLGKDNGPPTSGSRKKTGRDDRGDKKWTKRQH